MTPRQLRLLRAATASSVATFLAAVSHTVGGGAGPHPLLVLALSAFLTPVSAALIGSRPSRARLAVTVLAAQGAFHWSFQLLGAPTGSTGSAVLHGHLHSLDDLGPLESTASGGGGMLGAHVLAATLTALVLWHGERMLRAVAGWFIGLLRRVASLTPAAHERPVPLRSSPRPVSNPWLSSAVSRRGPPVHVCG